MLSTDYIATRFGEFALDEMLGEFLNAADINQKVIFNIISQHLKALAENFNKYFSEN
jgi:hypothetical protein